MTNVLVTGATGFLGAHLLERLCSRTGGSQGAGRGLRVLTREPDETLEVEGVSVVTGDLLDEDAVAKAVDGVELVYHLAGRVSRNPDDARELYRVHVEGTALLCRAAKRAGVRRIVLASTSGTVAVTNDGERIPDESAPPPLAIIGRWPYYTSKLYQEQTALRECEGEGGPELVILNPSLLLGPGDHRLSSTEDVLRLLAGEIPAVPPGGVNFVDVRDAADAFVAAAERGRAFERYLLGGPNWTFATFFERTARMSGVRGPRWKLPERVYGFAGRALEAIYGQLGQAPPVDRVSVEMGQRFWYVDASKARRELGFAPRDPYETIQDTVSFLRKTFLQEPVGG